MLTAIVQLFLSIMSSIDNKKIALGIKLCMFFVLVVSYSQDGSFTELIQVMATSLPQAPSV